MYDGLELRSAGQMLVCVISGGIQGWCVCCGWQRPLCLGCRPCCLAELACALSGYQYTNVTMPVSVVIGHLFVSWLPWGSDLK